MDDGLGAGCRACQQCHHRSRPPGWAAPEPGQASGRLARPRLVLQCQGRVSLTCPVLQPAADSQSLFLVPLIMLAFPPLPACQAPRSRQVRLARPRPRIPASPRAPLAPPARLHRLPLGIASLPRHTPASRPRALMLFQGGEGLTQPWLAGVFTPPKQGNSLPRSGGSPRGGEGALVLLEVLGPPCQRPAAALAGLPCACTTDICRIIHIFRLRGGSGLGFPQSRLSLSLPACWSGSTVSPPPCLQPPGPGHPTACPGRGTQQGMPRFAPATCFKDEADAVPVL